MILIDGLGIAPEGHSDLARQSSSFFDALHPVETVSLPGDGLGVPTSADLDVPGLPQSATGHTTLLTGINAALVLGRHFPGFPTPTLRTLIETHNLMGILSESGLRAAYVNACRPLMPITRIRNLRSATTIAAQSSGQTLRSVKDILNGEALYHDFTNRILKGCGESVPIFTPRRAGRILAEIADALDFALFEYFLTDLVGHAQDTEAACQEIEKIEGFLEGLLESLDLARTNLLVCSDHGNLEDLSVRTHTRNPVPTLLWGPQAEHFAARINSIEHIAPEILHILLSPQQQRDIPR
jgi:2,3-bisphosphoglycerate-independent phosphoglycerate mutase